MLIFVVQKQFFQNYLDTHNTWTHVDANLLHKKQKQEQGHEVFVQKICQQFDENPILAKMVFDRLDGIIA